jgi:hypothetical protein
VVTLEKDYAAFQKSAASVTATPPSRRAYVSRFAELRMNRRSMLTFALLALAARRLPLSAWTSRAEAQEKGASLVWRHGISPFGDLKYPSGFKQFDYVNANAPEGGAARQIALGTYDNFNMMVDGVRGALAVGIDLNYDTLEQIRLSVLLRGQAVDGHRLQPGVEDIVRPAQQSVHGLQNRRATASARRGLWPRPHGVPPCARQQPQYRPG